MAEIASDIKPNILHSIHENWESALELQKIIICDLEDSEIADVDSQTLSKNEVIIANKCPEPRNFEVIQSPDLLPPNLRVIKLEIIAECRFIEYYKADLYSHTVEGELTCMKSCRDHDMYAFMLHISLHKGDNRLKFVVLPEKNSLSMMLFAVTLQHFNPSLSSQFLRMKNNCEPGKESFAQFMNDLSLRENVTPLQESHPKSNDLGINMENLLRVIESKIEKLDEKISIRFEEILKRMELIENLINK